MATTVARLQAILDADTRRFDQKLRSSETKTQKFGAVAKTALIGGAAAGMYGLAKAAMIGWDEFNSGQKEAAQTAAVLKSTGGAANVTAAHVQAMGTELMKLSGIDDELVVNGENLLLTFRGIRNEVGKGNDIFDQATKLTLDLSTAMHTDMRSAAIQVGKALNDPIRGYSRLQRIGVDFSDAQIKQIESLDAVGDKMGAQKVILGELTKEFGGSAAAAGDTFAGKMAIARESLNNFLGDLVQKAIPHIEDFINWIGPIASMWLKRTRKFMDDLRERTAKFGEILQEHRPTIDKVVKVLKFLGDALIFVWKWEAKLYLLILDVWLKILGVVLDVTDKMISAFGKVRDAVEKVVDWFQKAYHWIKDKLGSGPVVAAINAVAAPFKVMKTVVEAIVDGIKWLVDHIPDIPDNPIPGWVPVIGGDGAVGVAQNPGGLVPNILDDLGLANSMGLTLTSGFRPGSITSSGNPSLHAVGRAIDVAGSGPGMRSFFGAEVVRAAATNLAEIIHSPYWWHPGSGVTRISDPQIMADHWDHVHVGTYDRGGFLRPGWNLAYNGLGRPERVGGGDVYVSVAGSVIAERDLHSLVRKLNEEHRRRGGV